MGGESWASGNEETAHGAGTGGWAAATEAAATACGVCGACVGGVAAGASVRGGAGDLAVRSCAAQT